MATKTLLTPAIMTGYTPHTDKSMTLRFRTQELSHEQKMDVIDHYSEFGWLGFVNSEDVTDLGIPEQPAVREGKSPSQRLRSVVFVFWKQQGEKGNFNQYYEDYINKQIDTIKDKLDDL